MNDTIIAYLQDEATTKQSKELFEWIRIDPENAREFARCSLMHAQLRGLINGEHHAQELPTETNTASGGLEKPSIEKQTIPQDSRRFNRVLFGSLAASLLIGVALLAYWLGNAYLVNGGNGEFVKSQRVPSVIGSTLFATVSQTRNVQWLGRAFQSGDRASAETFELAKGYVRLRLDSGVEVTLEGPAKLRLVSAEHAELDSGLLTAIVPPGAEGFRVDTPTAQIVDLGTVFGIHLDETGSSNVSVFDGAVTVAPRDIDEPKLIKEGESVRIASDKQIQSIAFESKRFEKLWPVSSGVAGSNGAFQFAPPWPRRLRLVRSSSEVFVVPEGYMTKLDEPLKVNISTPGNFRTAESLVEAEVPTGQTVRSFILHFHPEGDESRQRPKRVAGSITFARPVLGLIVLHEELVSSSTRFPGRKAGELLEHRQLEFNEGRLGDSISLSEDRLTVSVDLAAGRFSDLVRVIVDATNEN